MAPLDALMRKNAFLLGFSMAEQSSELHALDITMACSRCQDAAIPLLFNPVCCSGQRRKLISHDWNSESGSIRLGGK